MPNRFDNVRKTISLGKSVIRFRKFKHNFTKKKKYRIVIRISQRIHAPPYDRTAHGRKAKKK